MKVSKFGGNPLADSSQIKKALAIIQSDPERQCIVVSAPGKRDSRDQKVTDLLYEWHRLHELRLSTDEIRQVISDRYAEIIGGLGIDFDLAGELAEINQKINEGASADYAASRGEYLMAKIMAIALGYDFVDSADCIYFDQHGRYHQDDERLRAVLLGRKTVVSGFYGSLPDGSIKTFPRNSSDLSATIIARAVGASLCEIWKDVSGLLMADPRVVKNPRKVGRITYRELREITYAGTEVLFSEAMFPVQEAGIPINIRNVNDPDDPGTYVVAEDIQREAGTIIGVAGRKSFTVITVEKAMMNQEIGFARRILAVLEDNGISFEHMPSGIDTISLVIDDRQLNGKLEKVVLEIRQACSPDSVEVFPEMAMIAVVGRGMINTPGVAAKIFAALADQNINIRMINQGSSEISIFVGVENTDYENAVRAIYAAFVN